MKTKILFSAALIAATLASCQKEQQKPVVYVTQEQASEQGVITVVTADANDITGQVVPVVNDIRKDVNGFVKLVAKDLISSKNKADAKAEKRTEQCMKERKKMHEQATKKFEKLQKELAKHETISKREISSLVMQELTDLDKAVAYVPVRTGYYECPCAQERLNLYKLAVNGLLELNCEEIKKTDRESSYWVNVELTAAGKVLIRRELFPEEMINIGEAGLFITPVNGKDIYGRVIRDQEVAGDVNDLIHAYYKDMAANPRDARKHFSRDLQLAYDRIDSVATYKNQPFADPAVVPADANLDEMQIERWNQYEDAYIVNLAKKQVIMMVRQKDGKLVIDDIALCTPDKMNQQTVGKRGKAITNQEIYNLRKQAQKRQKATSKKKQKEPQIVEEPIYVNNDPGFIKPDLRNLTPAYQEAKDKEYTFTYELKAYETAIVKVAGREYAKRFCPQAPSKAKAMVTVQKKNVNAVGRVFCDAEEGAKSTTPFFFTYKEDEGWVVSTKCDYEFVPEMEQGHGQAGKCHGEKPGHFAKHAGKQCGAPAPAFAAPACAAPCEQQCGEQPCAQKCEGQGCQAMSTEEAVADIENSLEKMFGQYINGYANYVAKSLH